MRFFRPCFLAAWLFPDILFREKTAEKVLYLTFDDGPNILSTPLLLNILAKHNIKAVFFCSGKSASRNPDLIKKIKSEGHIVGNHGYNHLNGLLTSKQKYLTDVRKGSEYTSEKLFRPPFGKLTFPQYLELKKSYRIIFWDIMPFDFDRRFGSDRSLSILKKLVRPGSVIVLHDTESSTLLEFLEDFILFTVAEGYGFRLP
jgi:peptidoglycan/xylan/chitin deacetylase (PgdA/CDA1 family)